MHSSKPSRTLVSKVDPEIFLKLNSEPLEQLVKFLDFAPERLTLGFISINFSRDREVLLDLVRQDARCQDVQLVVFYFPDPKLRFLRDALLKELSSIQHEPGKKLVLVVTGLEYSIGMLGEYPLVLQDLNYVRDAFTASVPYPILVCLPDSALTRLARYAPDFWAWRMAVFQFKSSSMAVDWAVGKTLERGYQVGSLALADKQETTDLLLRLLNEYPANRQLETLEQIETRLCILNLLGKIYYSQGDFEKAKDVFEQVLQIAADNENLDDAKATASNDLGILQQDQGNVEEAIALYEQSLDILERIGDLQGKATTLNNMAQAIANQGDIDRALNLWQQDLDISERIGDVQGKATTLNNMAQAIADQGDIDRALNLWQQSLDILECIGDIQGNAATLNNIALVIANQGDIDRALDLWQQSLDIKERIGDVQGKAATLNNMATTAFRQGNTPKALEFLTQSAQALGQSRAYVDLVTVLNNLNAISEKENFTYLAQAVWLCLKVQVPLQETIRIFRDLFNAIPQDDELESLLAITAYLLCLQRGVNHLQLNQLRERSAQMLMAAANAQGIAPEAVESWMMQQQLNDPTVFLPRLNQRLEAMVGADWLFDQSSFNT